MGGREPMERLALDIKELKDILDEAYIYLSNANEHILLTFKIFQLEMMTTSNG